MLAAAALAVAVALAACAAPAAPSATPDGGPARVVSLAPAVTAIIVELGEAARLVGVTRYCAVPPTGREVAVVGDLEPRPEAILATRPDVVLMAHYGSQGDAAGKLAALGLDVRSFPLVTLADMRQTTLDVGRVLHADARAAALVADFDRAAEAARAAAARRGPVKVLLVYDVQPGAVLTTGGGDHLSELLALCGAVNVAAPGPLTARLGLEDVMARAPDVILHAAPDARFGDDAAAMAYWKAFPEVPAVKRGAVHVWPDDALARNGPHLARALERLSALLAK